MKDSMIWVFIYFSIKSTVEGLQSTLIFLSMTSGMILTGSFFSSLSKFFWANSVKSREVSYNLMFKGTDFSLWGKMFFIIVI